MLNIIFIKHTLPVIYGVVKQVLTIIKKKKKVLTKFLRRAYIRYLLI